MSGSNVLLKSAFLIASMAYSTGGEMADYSLYKMPVNHKNAYYATTRHSVFEHLYLLQPPRDASRIVSS